MQQEEATRVGWELRDMLGCLPQDCSSPEKGLAHLSLPGQPEQGPNLEIWPNVLPSSLAQRIQGHICWAKLSTCILDPKGSLFCSAFSSWQPCLSLSTASFPLTAAEGQQRGPRHRVRRLGIKAA